MIIINVSVPIMDEQFDFQIDEDVPFFEIRDEIVDMICRKMQCTVEGDAEQFMLWDKHTGKRIHLKRTGFENGLVTGSELILA